MYFIPLRKIFKFIIYQNGETTHKSVGNRTKNYPSLNKSRDSYFTRNSWTRLARWIWE